MDSIIIQKNIVYGETEREYLTADIYKPSNSDDELPILVLIHGGAFQSGSKEMYKEWGRNLAEEGYFVMAINYRLSTLTYSSYPGALEDIGQALNWLVAKSNQWSLDVERIGLIGDSAGAYLAALTSLKYKAFSYNICSVIGVYGIYDLVDECLNPINDREENIYEKFLGISFEGNEKAFKTASPVHYIKEAIANPTFDTEFLIIWGEKDKVVRPEQSKSFIEKLRKEGIVVESIRIEDSGHFFFNQLPYIDGGTLSHYPNTFLYPKLIDFLKRSVCESKSGNFSERQIMKLSAMQELSIMNERGDNNGRNIQ
ncbi:alpha/beta hydrolase [Margalitia sp. FSL K6-0131]|uniref:alpha/beta hydrolase n=1 Tax=Margalitia sp. FSL K6-0131 TaxID=2954604 RepID=UPI0030F8946E